jgi:transposase-like protein
MYVWRYIDLNQEFVQLMLTKKNNRKAAIRFSSKFRRLNCSVGSQKYLGK